MVYIYKDPNNLYKTKDEIVKLGEGNYRVIPNSYKKDNLYIEDIIGGNYFDVFIHKGSNAEQKNWGNDKQYRLFDFTSGAFGLFGNCVKEVLSNCGLSCADGGNALGFASPHYASRNGYFGPIKFI